MRQSLVKLKYPMHGCCILNFLAPVLMVLNEHGGKKIICLMRAFEMTYWNNWQSLEFHKIQTIPLGKTCNISEHPNTNTLKQNEQYFWKRYWEFSVCNLIPIILEVQIGKLDNRQKRLMVTKLSYVTKANFRNKYSLFTKCCSKNT